MQLWTFSTRLYYEGGILDFKYFPTLLPMYYVLLASYSLYALARVMEMPDISVMYHATYAAEALFLKLPMILSDLGIFLLIFRFTRDIRYSSLYFLNPFMIFLSGVWGMYDSVMMLPLVAGLVFVGRNERAFAGVSFLGSGLIKLFGLFPFVLLAIDNILQKRLKQLAVQMAVGVLLTGVVLSPLALGGLADFYTGFLLRFTGGGGVAESRTYNPLAILSGSKSWNSGPFFWGVGGLVVGLFLLARIRGVSLFKSMLGATIVAAISLTVLSNSEPQWLSWTIPLSILFAHSQGRESLAFFSYFFGTVVTFLVMTLTQTSGWLLTGIPVQFFAGLEGYYNSLAVYAFMTLSMVGMMAGYLVLKPTKLRTEIIVLTALLYAQAYYWLAVVRVI